MALEASFSNDLSTVNGSHHNPLMINLYDTSRNKPGHLAAFLDLRKGTYLTHWQAML